MLRRYARWFVVGVGGLLVGIGVLTAVASRSAPLREHLVSLLSEKLDSDVELGGLSVDTFPVVSITGEKLVVRKRGAIDPPLVSIERFTVEGGLIGFLSRPRRFRTVHLDGLQINISHRTAEKADDDGEVDGPSHVYIEQVLAHRATLTIIPKRVGKAPKVFAIHDLSLREVGFNRAMPFEAQLTNPVPEGKIDVKGTFGPWREHDPGQTPLAGRFAFRNADLGTIKGIGGILSADGEFSGPLERIAVRGTTDTPDFSIDVGGKGVPLSTRFDAMVDGTDGDTYLNRVDATFLKTSLTARGAVTGTRGVKGRTVQLDVRMRQGRIEDVLRLAVDASEPLMTGDMQLTTRLLLPPGSGPVSRRLQLDGTFALTRGEFEDGAVQRKLVSLSRRGRGLNDETRGAAGEVVSDLRGRFRLARGELHFADLTFGVPGAQVRMAGSYGLHTQALDFLGHLRMQATISEAMGGGKGFFLKPFDPLFRRNGAGAVVPLKIAGTRAEPKFGVDIRRALRRK